MNLNQDITHYSRAKFLLERGYIREDQFWGFIEKLEEQERQKEKKEKEKMKEI